MGHVWGRGLRSPACRPCGEIRSQSGRWTCGRVDCARRRAAGGQLACHCDRQGRQDTSEHSHPCMLPWAVSVRTRSATAAAIRGAAWSDVTQWPTMRQSCALVLIAALLAACGTATTSPSSKPTVAPSPTTTPSSTVTTVPSPPTSTEVQTYPPVPVGGIDCGISDEISGWPTTTTMPPSMAYSCLFGALSSGRPARYVVILPSNVDSGSKTSPGGYSIPAAILITYRVLGANQLQITTDSHEAGGSVTTKNCTGLSQPVPGSLPTPSGCTPD